MDDDLHELKTYFYLGNYAAAVTEGTTSAMDSTAAALERDVILARIEVATEKADDVIARVGDTSPTALRAVGLYAQYSKNDKSREATMKTLKEMLEDDVDGTNPTLLIMAAIMYADNKEYQNALRYANKGDTLEHAALKVQILIDMDRVDIAKKELAVMKRYALILLCSTKIVMQFYTRTIQQKKRKRNQTRPKFHKDLHTAGSMNMQR